MADLAPDQVRAQLGALGIQITDDDLPEVTHRVNALHEVLAAIDHPGLDSIEPLPVFWLEPGGGDGSTASAAGDAGKGQGATWLAEPTKADLTSDLLAALPVTTLAALLRSGQVSPVDLVNTYLDRIERYDGRFRAYINVCGDEALAAARQTEQELARGAVRGPLHGIPVAVKDQMDAKGMPTTAASNIYNIVAGEDCTVVARLRAAGAILLGKLNLNEFACGGNIVERFGTPRNPWNPDYNPGMSSSGPGIAVAASLCTAAIGEDTGGSVRNPASWCGITGLRPTWGRVSRQGILGLSWSMDQAGPLTKTVEDCALVFQAIAGYDPKDRFTSRRPVPNFQPIVSARGLRLGVVSEAIETAALRPEVRAAVEQAIRVLEDAGAVVKEVSVPLLAAAGPISVTISDVDAAFLHRQWLRTRPEDYDFVTRRRLLAASLVPGQLHEKACRLRVLIHEQLVSALREVDILVTPTQNTPAPKIYATTGIDSKEDVVRRFYSNRGASGPFNLAGLPAMSIPCGFTAKGLPIGLQLAGRAFDELTVFQAGHAYQQATDWHTQQPPVV